MSKNHYMPDQMRNLDYYARLKVRRDASDHEIGLAFRREREHYRLMIRMNPGYEECYVLLEEAFNKLKDPEFRKTYVLPEIPKEPLRIVWALVITWTVVFAVLHYAAFWMTYNAEAGSLVIYRVILCGVAGFVALIAFSRANKGNQVMATLLLTFTLCANMFFVHSRYQKQWLYLDNQNTFTVDVLIDGEKVKSLSDYQWDKIEVRIGEHTVESYKSNTDSLLEKFDVVTNEGVPFLYNVLSNGKYRTGTEMYSKWAYFMESPYDNPTEFAQGERWMHLGYDYIFASAPSEVKVFTDRYGNGSTEETRTYILRKESPDDQW
jgi:hypothetical protein